LPGVSISIIAYVHGGIDLSISVSFSIRLIMTADG
jgi:hypothetical protein